MFQWSGARRIFVRTSPILEYSTNNSFDCLLPFIVPDYIQGMNDKKVKEDFLFHLELYFRNFGNEWTISDFPRHFVRQEKMLTEYLKELEQLGIVEMKNASTFIIKKLPSTIVNN